MSNNQFGLAENGIPDLVIEGCKQAILSGFAPALQETPTCTLVTEKTEDPEVLSVMDCQGDVNIQLVLKMSPDDAIQVGQDILQLELSMDDLGDTLAELINIVAGHLGHHLTPHGLDASFGLPNVGSSEIYNQTAPFAEMKFKHGELDFNFMVVMNSKT